MADRKKFLTKFLPWAVPIFLVIVGFTTRYYNLKDPPIVLFDEAYFGLYAERYLDGQFYFDIHPPLGKLAIGAVAALSGAKAGFPFEVGTNYSGESYIWMRGMPAFFGSLLALLVYSLAGELGFSERASFLAGFFVLFDNALLVQSRLILLDMILVFFIFLSFLLYFLMKKQVFSTKKWYFTAGLLGVSLGISCSIKWTGFGVFALIFFLLSAKDHLFSKAKKEAIFTSLLVFILPFLVYAAAFAIHFNLLPSPCRDNCGNVVEGSSKGFNETKPLEGNFIGKFLLTNLIMADKGLKSDMGYFYESVWWSWPLMVRPMPYFISDIGRDGTFRSYFLIGNPLVWFFSLASIIVYFYLKARRAVTGLAMKLPAVFCAENFRFLVIGYLAYLLPFAFVPRFMLIYHYFPALIFGIMLASATIDAFLNKMKPKQAGIVFCGIIFLTLASFVFFAPLTYGFPLSQEEFLARMWLPTWNYNP